MLDPESPDVLVAVFGREVELFLESDLGLYLSQCCEAEVENAISQLKKVSPVDSETIKTLQNQIWRAESVMGWLKDAMNSGKQARQAIEESQ